jgi:ferredoxin
MDAIVGMEGNGPSAGPPRNIGLVLASSDSVALDAVASKIIGLEPLKIHTTSIAHQRGLGVGDLARIEILGEKLADVKITDFELPSNAMLETMPGFVVRGLIGLLKARPEINTKACVGCRFCVESCPVEAMSITTKFPEIDYQKCISCLCCQELCPQKAVEMKQKHAIGRALAGIMSHSKDKRRAGYKSE